LEISPSRFFLCGFGSLRLRSENSSATILLRSATGALRLGFGALSHRFFPDLSTV
jgi:hypothetical protein